MKLFKNKKAVLFLLLTVLFYLMLSKHIISLDAFTGNESNSVHFNLITVNSVFAGFLFSSLTLLVGLSSTKTVIVLERSNYMESIYKNIISGLITSLVSIIASLICIFIVPSIKNNPVIVDSYIIKNTLIYLGPSIVLLFIIFTITSFFIAIKDVSLIIKSIRRKSLKSAPSKESVSKTLEQIKWK